MSQAARALVAFAVPNNNHHHHHHQSRAKKTDFFLRLKLPFTLDGERAWHVYLDDPTAGQLSVILVIVSSGNFR